MGVQVQLFVWKTDKPIDLEHQFAINTLDDKSTAVVREGSIKPAISFANGVTSERPDRINLVNAKTAFTCFQ